MQGEGFGPTFLGSNSSSLGGPPLGPAAAMKNAFGFLVGTDWFAIVLPSTLIRPNHFSSNSAQKIPKASNQSQIA